MLGRPTDCTPELEILFIKSLESGLSVERTCDLCEISPTTFYAWKSRAKSEEQPFADFMNKIKKTKAEWIKKTLLKIEQSAEDREVKSEKGFKTIAGDWTARAWLLERLHRQDFSKNVTKIALIDPPKNLSSIEEIIFMNNDIIQRMRSGDISGEEANLASQVLEYRRKILETSEYEKRMCEIEEKLGIVKK